MVGFQLRGRTTTRVTQTANKNIKRPMKFTIRASWERPKPKLMKVWANPISVVHIAKRNMTMPIKMCQGINVALVDFSAPGAKNVKKASNHFK